MNDAITVSLRKKLDQIKDEIKLGPIYIETAYGRVLLRIADEAITALETRTARLSKGASRGR